MDVLGKKDQYFHQEVDTPLIRSTLSTWLHPHTPPQIQIESIISFPVSDILLSPFTDHRPHNASKLSISTPVVPPTSHAFLSASRGTHAQLKKTAVFRSTCSAAELPLFSFSRMARGSPSSKGFGARGLGLSLNFFNEVFGLGTD